MLIQNNLFFLQQPYSAKADVEVRLDDLTVVDPDDEKVAGKVALSTYVLCGVLCGVRVRVRVSTVWCTSRYFFVFTMLYCTSLL